MAAYQARLSMGFPKQKYWSELSFLSLGDSPNPGIELTSPESPSGGFFTTSATQEAQWNTAAAAAAAAANSLQSFPTLCDPIDGSLPGSAIPGILQARTLEWVAISFSNA